MYIFWKLSIPLLLRHASSLKCTRLLKEGSSHCRRNYWKKWLRRVKSRLYQLQSRRSCKCYGYRICLWRTRITVVRAKCSAACFVRRFSTAHLSKRSSTSTVRALLLPRSVLGGWTMQVSLMLRSMVWIESSGVYNEDTCLRTHSCRIVTTVSAEN